MNFSKRVLFFIIPLCFLIGCNPKTGEENIIGSGQNTAAEDAEQDVSGSTTLPEDATPPNPISHLEILPDNQKISISWVNPEDVDLAYVCVEYVWNESPDMVLGSYNTYDPPGSFCSYILSGLTNGFSYTLFVYAVDLSGNLSEIVTKEFVPEDKTPPGPVENIVVEEKYDYNTGLKYALIRWTNPVSANLSCVRVTCRETSGYLSPAQAALASQPSSHYGSGLNQEIKITMKGSWSITFVSVGKDGKEYSPRYASCSVGF